MPEISVIVPVYNVEKYLNRCVESILNQTYTDFELILVDDGSPDNCPQMCDYWAKKDKRIRVIHQKNQGVSAARNLGIEIALKEENISWIMFVDSDDWLHERTLDILLKANIENKTDISICGFEKTYGVLPLVNLELLGFNVVNTEDFYVEHNANAVVVWAKLYKKDLFCDVIFPVGLRYEDEYTSYKILFKCNELSFINQPMYAYYMNPESFMSSEWSPKRFDAFLAVKEQISFFSQRQYYNAYKNSVHLLFYVIYYNYFNMLKIKTEKKHKKIVKREMLNAIHKYKKIEGITFKNDKKYYDVAYPLFMRFYWIIVSILKKVKRSICRKKV